MSTADILIRANPSHIYSLGYGRSDNRHRNARRRRAARGSTRR
ncbi:hypothetical protein BN903_29 [Halorubrum sp. AJ67]|nr:hypothetical protein BN903_29 [Halorubrum sp. AJ67]